MGKRVPSFDVPGVTPTLTLTIIASRDKMIISISHFFSFFYKALLCLYHTNGLHFVVSVVSVVSVVCVVCTACVDVCVVCTACVVVCRRRRWWHSSGPPPFLTAKFGFGFIWIML